MNNQDSTGEKEILVVSFGTADQEALVEDIGGIEAALENAYPDYSVQRAFTSKLSMQRIKERDGVCIDDLESALKRAVDNGVKELRVVPTHLVHAEKYEDVVRGIRAYESQFEKVSIAAPLLGEFNEDTIINESAIKVTVALTADCIERAGYDNLRLAAVDGVALVLVGHGTKHSSGEAYALLQDQVEWLGYENVFVGTIEGEPEDTECYHVLRDIAIAGYTKVILRPLLVAVGKHAREDIAGKGEDSWVSRFVDSEAFDSVSVQTMGIGRVKSIQEIYVQGAMK